MIKINEQDTLREVKEHINSNFDEYYDIIAEGEHSTELGKEGVRTMSDMISLVAIYGTTEVLIEDSLNQTVSDTDKAYFVQNQTDSLHSNYVTESGQIKITDLTYHGQDVLRSAAIAVGYAKDKVVPKRENLYITSAYENDGYYVGETYHGPKLLQCRPRINFKNLSVTSSTDQYTDSRYNSDFKYLNVIENIIGFSVVEKQNIEGYIPHIIFGENFLKNNTLSSTCESYSLLQDDGSYKVYLKFWSDKNLTNQPIPLIGFVYGNNQ